jgi:creatinine amidohydrolase
LKIWRKGGKKAREITPLGYCGNPSEIDLEAAKAFEEEIVEGVSKRIYDLLKGKR